MRSSRLKLRKTYCPSSSLLFSTPLFSSRKPNSRFLNPQQLVYSNTPTLAYPPLFPAKTSIVLLNPHCVAPIYKHVRKFIRSAEQSSVIISIDYICIWAGIATRYGLDGPGIESRCGRDLPPPPDRPWGLPTLLHNGYRVFLGGKAAGAWCWPSTPI